MTAPDQKTVRELATEHILDDARQAHDIGAAVLGHYGPDALTKHEYHAWCSAIREAIATATIAVSWPDEQPAAEQAAGDRAAVEAAVAHVRQVHTWRAERGYATHDYGDDAIATLLDEVERLGQVEQNAATRVAGLVAWNNWCGDVYHRHDDDPLICTLDREHVGKHCGQGAEWPVGHDFGDRNADLAARDEREAGRG